jgi:hypothetical protein
LAGVCFLILGTFFVWRDRTRSPIALRVDAHPARLIDNEMDPTDPLGQDAAARRDESIGRFDDWQR